MCNCGNINNNVLDLTHLKIYTAMAKYQIIKKYQGCGGNLGEGNVAYDRLTQEELAYYYEEKGFSSLITKVSDEKSTSKKKNKGSKNESKASDKE